MSPIPSPRLSQPRPDSVVPPQPSSRPPADSLQPTSALQSPKNNNLLKHGPRASQSPPMYASPSAARLVVQQQAGDELRLPPGPSENEHPQLSAPPRSMRNADVVSNANINFMNGKESIENLVSSQSRDLPSLNPSAVSNLKSGVMESSKVLDEGRLDVHRLSPKPGSSQLSSTASRGMAMKSAESKSQKSRFPSEGDAVHDSQLVDLKGRMGKPLQATKRTEEFRPSATNQEMVHSQENSVPLDPMARRFDDNRAHSHGKNGRDSWVSSANGSGAELIKQHGTKVEVSVPLPGGQSEHRATSAVPSAVPMDIDSISKQTRHEKTTSILENDKQKTPGPPAKPSHRSQDAIKEAGIKERLADGSNSIAFSPSKSASRPYGHTPATGQASLIEAEPRWEIRNSDTIAHNSWKSDSRGRGASGLHGNIDQKPAPDWKPQSDLDVKSNGARTSSDAGHAQSNPATSGNMWISGMSTVPKPHPPPRAVQSRPQVRPFAPQPSHAQSQSSYSQNSNAASNSVPGSVQKNLSEREKAALHIQTTTAHSNSMSKTHREAPAKTGSQSEKPLSKALGPSPNRPSSGSNPPVVHESTSMRSIDGAGASSLHPFSSGSQPPGHGRGDSAEHGANSQRRLLKVEDALAYLEKVKAQFSNEVSVYNKFLDIMKDFKAQTIDTTEVIKRVSELFLGHEDLILGFNTFLPPGYKIEVRENRNTGAFNTGFVGPHGHYSELPVFRRPGAPRSGPLRSRSGKKQPTPPPIRSKDAKGDITKVAQSSAPPTAGPASTKDSKDRCSGMSPSTPTVLPVTLKEVSSSQKPISLKEHEGTKHFSPAPQKHVPQQQPSKKVESYQGKSSELDQVLGFISDIKSRFSDKPQNFEQFLDTFHHFRSERSSIREVYNSVAKLLGPHKDLLVQFGKFIPRFAKPILADVSKPSLPKNRRQPVENTVSPPATACRDVNISNCESVKNNCPPNLKFFEKFKIQLGPRKAHLYNEFVKCLSLASQGIVTKDELLILTAEILNNSPDAQKAFVAYLEVMGDCEDGDSGGDGSSPPPGIDPPIDPERLNYFRSKPMSEVASESGYDAIYSYRRMPKDFPKCTHTGRSSMERRVLNDTWVNITTGSEDYAFVRKNTSEDNLFRAEDDRYELDMVISANQATILKLEAVISTMAKLPPNEKKGHALASGVLSPIHFNAIRRIYGTHGDEMVSQVKMNPSNAVGIVLKRLKQKDDEWRKVRSTMHRLWREVGERNYHKSLDHRSTFFKVVDKKDLSLKNLLTDILDPVGSMTSRDSEMTRVRTYAIPKGAGGSADWSGAVTAVAAAAQVPVDLAPRSLELKFERSAIHQAVMGLIKNVASDDASPDVRKCVGEFERLLCSFFNTDPDIGTVEKRDSFERISNGTQAERCHKTAATQNKRHTNDYDVLYGDDAIYTLLRLYHLLYERVLNAWILSNDQIHEKNRRDKLTLKASLENAELMKAERIIKPRIMKVGIGQDLGVNRFALCPERETATEIFAEFLDIALPFIRGKLECVKYEERCRVLLGTKCYSVFTLDKLMHRLMKQIGVVFCSDVSSRELVSLYTKSKDTQKYSSGQKVSLSPEGLQEIYCIAASRHMAETRGSGSHLMRFSREHCDLMGQEVDVGELKVGVLRGEVEQRRRKAVDEVGCLLTIEVIGKTGDDEHGLHDRDHQNMVDALLEFCGSFGDKNVRGSGKVGSDVKKKDGDGTSSGRGEWRKDSKRSYEDDGRADRNRVKKRKVYKSELMKFCGDRKDMVRRAKTVVSKDDLIFRLDVNGVMNFVGGTGDYTFVRGQKRKWLGTVDPQSWNDRSLATRQVRKKFKLDQRPTSSREGRKGLRMHS